MMGLDMMVMETMGSREYLSLPLLFQACVCIKYAGGVR